MLAVDMPWLETTDVETMDLEYKGTRVPGLPKMYSVTPEEELKIIPILGNYARKQSDEAPDLEVIIRDFEVPFAALALRRLDRTVGEESVKRLPRPLVAQLARYMMSERNGWVEPVASDPKPQPQTGEPTSEPSEPQSPQPTGDSQPDGPRNSAAKTSASSRSAKSTKQ